MEIKLLTYWAIVVIAQLDFVIRFAFGQLKCCYYCILIQVLALQNKALKFISAYSYYLTLISRLAVCCVVKRRRYTEYFTLIQVPDKVGYLFVSNNIIHNMFVYSHTRTK